MAYPAIPTHRLERLMARARSLPETEHGIEFPEWYLRQWHFHPDGYLSRDAIRRYELLVRRLYNAGMASTIERAICDLARRYGGRRLLDLGCGTGHLVATLGRDLPEATVFGLDLSPFMLRRARLRCIALPNVHVVHADATHGQQLPRDIDLAVAVHFLGHIPPEKAALALQNSAEALTEDGRLITVEHWWHRAPAVPEGLRVWQRHRLLGGLFTLREYRQRPAVR